MIILNENEVIIDTTDNELIDGAKTVINFLNITASIETAEEIEKYNNDV